jgi:nucleoid DNA-binding protein
MDITKYIGLFLLKNHSCYIQGLGNLELKNVNASYDGQTLHAQSCEVVLNPIGAIDDSLANFIATNELISISKAVNALRDFTMQCKADLQAGKEVAIPYIGKFHENEGKIWFSTDPKLQFTPANIPAVRVAKRIEEQPEYKPKQQQRQQQYRQQQQYAPPPPPPPQPYYNELPQEEEEEGRSINWGRVIFMISMLFVLGVGGLYLYQIYKERNANKNMPPLVASTPDTTQTHVQQVIAPPPPVDTSKAVMDSISKHDTNTVLGPDILENGESSAPVTTPATSKLASYTIVLNKYYTEERAQKRLTQLKTYGYNVKMLAEDSSNYLILMNVNINPKDKQKMLDSLSSLFNPNDGVYVR